MNIVTAATDFEMAAFCRQYGENEKVTTFVTGIGPVETATRLASFLATFPRKVSCVLNIGIGGAYLGRQNGVGLLDLCLAKHEILGDLGICFDDRIEPLPGEGLGGKYTFELDQSLLRQACDILDEHEIVYKVGNFVTVNGVSATERRGTMLGNLHQGLCENMEGAAAARVCEEFAVPLVELRCISNLVEDRNRENWQIKPAADKCAEAAAMVLRGMLDEQR
ncbi:futalosine hydrolase [Desulfogranum marinum]|uniref:futalosine hydrolase n=1 Tax=Desulfogranum marinum TaxID=453220 RepID=UPI001964EF28|nr:futalosine hydrolase [Desulfogranum marinum]MBM9513727.1 futalosine hydrolase [Desulfogranum marinum]